MGIHEDFSARSDDFSHQNDLTPGFSEILLELVCKLMIQILQEFLKKVLWVIK
jgi:hypothetical protein